jgi:general secretion pathway protein D
MQHRWIRAGVIWMAMAICIGRAWSADTDLVTLNFVNADIEGVVKAVSKITGKNFVLDPRVKGTVNIISAKPISRALVYDVFLSALRMQGYAAIEGHGVVKIVPEADARLYPTPTRDADEAPRAGGDRIRTQVFTLKYESAEQLVPILRPLISPNNPITAYPASNSLVITDYAGNLRRIDKIIEAIDQPSDTEPVVIPLRYASALDDARTVSKLFPDTPQAVDPTQRLTVVADARSNSLIVRCGNPSRLFRLRSLVAILDSPTSAAGNIHVIYLKNAEAVKLAATLRAIYGDKNATTATGPVQTPLTPLGTSASEPMQTQSGSFGAADTGQAEAAALAPGIIQADPATNSLIITAPDAIYNNLRATVEKLDVRRAQVYVEALIAEVTSDKAAEFGVQWQKLGGAGGSGSAAFGGTNFGGPGQNIIGISQNPGSAGAGLNVGVINGVVTLPGINTPVLNLGVLVRALEADSKANILSTPTLLTLDNKTAKIVIGENVPFITGQYAVSGAATTPTPFQTIERKDVGLTLQIRPQISQGGAVRLQIYAEVSSILDSNNAAGVITNKRSIESTVLVNDGQIVVIGGLIQDSLKNGVQKVPLLGDIPFIGNLFRYDSIDHSKTNLMIFLQPTIVRDAQAADPVTSERYNYILGVEKSAKPTADGILPHVESPALPARPPMHLAPPPSAAGNGGPSPTGSLPATGGGLPPPLT